MNMVDRDKPQKQVYAVIGMGRSGTSTIARGLNALGVDFGKKLTPGNDKWNPKGFFEDTDIVYQINRRVMETLEHSWVSIVDNLEEKRADLQGIRQAATELLQQRLANTHYFGFKDTRTAQILPFWQDIFKTLDLHDSYIIAVRNPIAAAHSYQRVGEVSIETALLFWLVHLIPAIDGTEGKPRVMVNYELVLKDPMAQVKRIKEKLNIAAPTDETELDYYANQFVDKKLQHFEHTLEQLKSHPATQITPLCVTMYELFIKLARDEITFKSAEFISTWQQVKVEFAKIYPTYRHIGMLLDQNKQLERTIRTIKKSLPWKIAYPLRILDDALRARRYKTRQTRRAKL